MGFRNRRTGDVGTASAVGIEVGTGSPAGGTTSGGPAGARAGAASAMAGATAARASATAGATAGATADSGTIARLRNPPGGRDARFMLVALFLDRTSSGAWSSASVLYFTVVAGLSAGQVGLLLGVAGLVGIAGSPIAGRLAERLPVRSILVTCHAVRV